MAFSKIYITSFQPIIVGVGYDDELEVKIGGANLVEGRFY